MGRALVVSSLALLWPASGWATASAAYQLQLKAPPVADYGSAIVFRGQVVPAREGVRVALYRPGRFVASGLTRASGGFRITIRAGEPGTFRARFAGRESNAVSVRIRPRIEASLNGAKLVGAALALVAQARPQAAGALRVQIWRGGQMTFTRVFHTGAHVRLATEHPSKLRVRVSAVPSVGYAAQVRSLAAVLRAPLLAAGSKGPSVRELERRLADLHYALQRIDNTYGPDTYEAVLAFQKVYGLPRTGRVGVGLWRLLIHASTPRARYGGTHIEVDKTRQVLFDVRGGKVVLVVHVSTGATGNTPAGAWHVYRKVQGWSWVLWYPMYFLRGFAIHGYPDVPPYPASHGCVRTPMWIAPRLNARHPFGTTVYVYA